VVATVVVAVWAQSAAAADAKLLPPEEAFRFSARALDERTLEARFTIADGYYLYRDKLRFALPPGGLTLGTPELPAGKTKHDQFFGDVETYRGSVVVRIPLSGAERGKEVELAADSQGCADVGVCYPPTRQKITLAIPASGQGPGQLQDASPAKKNWFR
jgi:thiol:disulfide interchange protein DsbD